MQKDESIRRKVIAAIRRTIVESYHPKFTAIHEFGTLEGIDPDFEYDHMDGELPITTVILDGDRWSHLTTRRVITKHNGKVETVTIDASLEYDFGPFKRNNEGYVMASLKKENRVFRLFIETGAPSMAMIYGVTTLSSLRRDTRS